MAAHGATLVEAFHLAFLRLLLRSVPASKLAVKGGCNIRFFFGSMRYSEDIDLDVAGIPVFELRDKVTRILESGGLAATLRVLGVAQIKPPDLARAKQTQTMQRFKVHLHTTAGEDLPTKVEFSRRGLDSPVEVAPVLASVIGAYKMPSLIAPHYAAVAAVRQKISALTTRRHPQARDIFDLFVLAPRANLAELRLSEHFSPDELERAHGRVYAIDYPEYRDKVVSFLATEDQVAFDSSEMWDEIRLLAIGLLETGFTNGG